MSRLLLHKVIVQVVAGKTLTYRQITDEINEGSLYPQAGGLRVAGAQVRACIRSHPTLFRVDRSEVPHKIGLA